MQNRGKPETPPLPRAGPKAKHFFLFWSLMFESCARRLMLLEVAASQTEAPSLKSPVATHAQPLARLQPGVDTGAQST